MVDVSRRRWSAPRRLGGRRTSTRQGVRRPALLHQDRREPRVGRADVEQPRQHRRPQPRVEVVDVGLEDERSAARRGRRRGHHRARAAACWPPRRVATAGADPGAGDPHRRHRSPRVTTAASSAAPVGVHHLVRRRPAVDRGAGEQLRGPRAPGRAAFRARVGAAGAERDRRGGAVVRPSACSPVHGADDVGDRVERADLVEVHLVGRDAVHGASAWASRPNTSRAVVHRLRPGRPARAARARRPRSVRRRRSRPSTWTCRGRSRRAHRLGGAA